MFLTIRYFIADLIYLLENNAPGKLGGKKKKDKEKSSDQDSKSDQESKLHKSKTVIRVIFQVIITITILAICIPIILKGNYSSESKQMAWGLLGTISGYWLR